MTHPKQGAVPDESTCSVHVLDYAQTSTRLDSLAVLSPAEQERAGRYARDEDRCRFVARRAFLRSLLGERLGADPAALRIASGPSGQPLLEMPAALVGVPPVCFSVSTSRSYAVIALSSRPVGVDVEDMRPGVWDRAAAALVLSTDELAWVDSQEHRDAAFLRCWTRKEAFAKLDGAGLFDGIELLTLTPSCSLERIALAEMHCVEGAHIAIAQSATAAKA